MQALLTVFYAFALAHADKLKHDLNNDGDRGEIVQTVIIIAAFAAAAIVITAVLVSKARTAANSVKTQ